MNNIDEIIRSEIQKIVDKVAERKINTNIFLSSRQLDVLSQLSYFSTHRILNDIEVEKDPRKIAYKSNQEIKTALVALCLTIALINHRSKSKYNKERITKEDLKMLGNMFKSQYQGKQKEERYQTFIHSNDFRIYKKRDDVNAIVHTHAPYATGFAFSNKEIKRLEGELKSVESEIARANGKLSNQGFLEKAPKALVDSEHAKLDKYIDMRNKILKSIHKMSKKW